MFMILNQSLAEILHRYPPLVGNFYRFEFLTAGPAVLGYALIRCRRDT